MRNIFDVPAATELGELDGAGAIVGEALLGNPSAVPGIADDDFI